MDDRWRLSQILAWQADAAIAAGDPIAARMVAEEGRDLADTIGDAVQLAPLPRMPGFGADYGRANWPEPSHNSARWPPRPRPLTMGSLEAVSLGHQGTALAWQGDTAAARAAADASLGSASEFGGLAASVGYFALGNTALAAGDVETALDATAAAWEHGSFAPGFAAHLRPIIALATLAGRDLIAARRWADDAVAMAPGWAGLMWALTTRARVAIAQGEPEQAERDAHDALASIPEGFRLGVSDTLECLAGLAGDAGSHREAARLFGAAQAIRQRMGVVRFKVWDAGCEASVAACEMSMDAERLRCRVGRGRSDVDRRGDRLRTARPRRT